MLVCLAAISRHDKRGARTGWTELHGHCDRAFALAAAAIVAFWGWLWPAVQMPPSPLAAGEKLTLHVLCAFSGDQNPFGPDIPIDPRQIDEAWPSSRRSPTACAPIGRPRSRRIPEIARRHGMKVLQGLWVSNQPDKTRQQVETAIALAKRYPDVISAVVVGTGVAARRRVGARARPLDPRGQGAGRGARDLRRRGILAAPREIAAAVDFVTVHILPYWEDFPIPARCGATRRCYPKQIVTAFPTRTSSSANLDGRAPAGCEKAPCRRR